MTLVIASFAWCTLQSPEIPPLISTGDLQTTTWATTWTQDISPSVLTWTSEQTGLSAQVKTLIEERQAQPKDETKLTEEDIGLMEQIIQKVQNLGK